MKPNWCVFCLGCFSWPERKLFHFSSGSLVLVGDGSMGHVMTEKPAENGVSGKRLPFLKGLKSVMAKSPR